MWVIVEVDDAGGSFTQTLAPVIQQTSNWSERRHLKEPLRVSGCWMLVCVNLALWKLGLVFRGNGRFPFDQGVRDISWLLALILEVRDI